jgi:hypothetical protein
MQNHCAAARKVLRELDNELAASAKRAGQELVWDAADRAVMELIAAEIDRKTDLAADYQTCDDLKSRVKASAEMRLLEQSIARLLRQIHTDLAPAPSMRTIKARSAARARWDRTSAG